MVAKNYIVKFFRKAERDDDKDTFLGSVELDDVGTSYSLTIVAKAFRQAQPRCLFANKVQVQQVR